MTIKGKVIYILSSDDPDELDGFARYMEAYGDGMDTEVVIEKVNEGIMITIDLIAGILDGFAREILSGERDEDD